jgi:hypothetical protein
MLDGGIKTYHRRESAMLAYASDSGTSTAQTVSPAIRSDRSQLP